MIITGVEVRFPISFGKNPRLKLLYASMLLAEEPVCLRVDIKQREILLQKNEDNLSRIMRR
jgi:hypothetical protein